MSASTFLVLRNGCRLCGGHSTANGIGTVQWLQARAYGNHGNRKPDFRNWRRQDAAEPEMTRTEARKEMKSQHTKARAHIKSLTHADRLDKVETFVATMTQNHLIPETRTINDAMKAFSMRSEYVPNAFEALDKLFQNGKRPNDRTFVQLFNMCAVHFPHHYSPALSLHRTLNRRHIKVSVPVANAAIKAFAKYGDSNTAIKIFMDMQKRDVTRRQADREGEHADVDKKTSGRGRRGAQGEDDLLAEELEGEAEDGGSRPEDLRPGQKLHSVSPAVPLVTDDIVQRMFTPYAGLKPNVRTYVSLLSAAACDSRHRLFRPSNYLAANLAKLEEVWTPDVRRRYSLAMADAVWDRMMSQEDTPPTVEAFIALLTAYRDAGRVDFLPLPKEFVDERRKQLLIQKGQLRRYDASNELLAGLGERPLADAEAERKAAQDRHMDLVYPDDADDAVAAFWTPDAETLKQPLDEGERLELAGKAVPFGGPGELLHAMTTCAVAPTTGVFHVMWQCQASAVTGGPGNARLALSPEVRAELGKLDASQYLALMQKYHCTLDERFFNMMLRHQVMARNYDATVRLLHSAAMFGVERSLHHYCEAALACGSQEQGFDLLLDLQEYGLMPDAVLYEALVMAALHRRHYGWTYQILKLILKAGLVPTSKTIAAVRKELSRKEHQQNEKHDKAQWRHFRQLYAFFTQRVLPLAEPEPAQEFEADDDTRSFLGLDEKASEPEEKPLPEGWTPLSELRRRRRR